MKIKSLNYQSLNGLVIAGLTIALGASIPVPALARSMPSSTTCQATIAIGQGTSLTYRLVGVINDRVSSDTPQNPIGRTITMTVQRRDRNGRITTVLNQSPAEDYEWMAPDADYSKLPFTGGFRGKPNDGFRLYGVRAATHGLYVSLRPSNGKPKQMQIVHYLNADNFVRSTAGSCQS